MLYKHLSKNAVQWCVPSIEIHDVDSRLADSFKTVIPFGYALWVHILFKYETQSLPRCIRLVNCISQPNYRVDRQRLGIHQVFRLLEPQTICTHNSAFRRTWSTELLLPCQRDYVVLNNPTDQWATTLLFSANERHNNRILNERASTIITGVSYRWPDRGWSIGTSEEDSFQRNELNWFRHKELDTKWTLV